MATSTGWKATLAESANLFDRSGKARKKASTLLWQGAQQGIEEWLPEADTDVSGEGLYGELLDAMGDSRKGDASKIKAVALAVKDHGLVLSLYPNLSKAYAEATRLTKTVKQESAEDEAAEAAVEAIGAPKSTSSAEGAAKIVLSKGMDEAARLLLDALNVGVADGGQNTAAHRALLRALAQEIQGRIPKPQPKPKAPAKAKGAAKKATVAKDGAAKAKPAKGTKAKPVASSDEPVEAKAQPVKAQPKAKPVEAEPVTDDFEDFEDEASDNAVSVPDVPKKGKPVVVRRG